MAAGSALLAPVAAQQNASTFVFSETVANLTLSLTAVAQTGDLWFRLEAPAEYDWVAIGIGSQMKGALTFVTYPSKNGTAITLSPRLSTGHTEPEYNSKIDAYKVDLTNHTENFVDAANGGVMQMAFVCRNCTNWPSPPLDLSDTSAPFMFAVGPISDQTGMRWFNSPSAPLRSHLMWGQFTMDMTVATVQSPEGVTVPQLQNFTVGASNNVTRIQNDPYDYGSAFHAITMCLAVGLFLPFDVLVFKLFRKIRFHMWTQGITLGLFIIGLGLGFWVAPLFVRVSWYRWKMLVESNAHISQSKNFNSGHEILGFFMIVLILVQLYLGISHHRQREAKRKEFAPASPPQDTKTKYTSHGFIHSVLGLLIFFLGIVECAVGFDFALSVAYNKLWVPLVLAVVIILLFVYGIRYCFDTNKKDQEEFAELDRRNAEAWQQYQTSQNERQQNYAQPQMHGQFGAYKQPDVEMRPVGQSGQGYGQVGVPQPY